MKRHMVTRLKSLLILGIASSAFYAARAQSVEQDQLMIQRIFEQSLSDDSAYEWLRYLTQNIGGRLSGSVQAEQAVGYTYDQLKSLKLDRVEKQPVMVPKWVRGPKEYAYFETEPGKTTSVPVCALGGSIATPGLGIKAEIIEVKGLSGLADLSDEEVKGKIVFFNEPMDPKFIETFSAYGKAGSQRTSGPAAAARKGAVAVVVRSLNLALDD
ncbi:MAG: peptidase M28 family protein, partial [Flavobacteriaceae bacterium]